MTEQTMQVIITKLDMLTDQMADIKIKVDRIAIQDNEISNMQKDISALWRNVDDLQKPGGTIYDIQKHQAGCPKAQIKMIWWAIGILATVLGAIMSVVVK